MTRQPRDCDRCGNPYQPVRASSRFCSDACRNAWNHARPTRRKGVALVRYGRKR